MQRPLLYLVVGLGPEAHGSFVLAQRDGPKGGADKAVRAAALEVLGLHGGERAHEWFWKGLTDPEPHVRLGAVKFLDRLDPQAHRDIFETALYDPHPQVAQAAEKLIKGMGYKKMKW